MSRAIWHRKAGAGDAIGKGRWSDIRPYEKPAHLLVCSPATKAFFTEFRQTSPSRLFSRCILIGCIHPMCNRGRDIDDYYQKKTWINLVAFEWCRRGSYDTADLKVCTTEMHWIPDRVGNDVLGADLKVCTTSSKKIPCSPL